MTLETTFVVVGAGLAGAKAVETLRAEGFPGRVVLVGREDERPYERPPLSKDYLTGSKARDTIYVHDADWYTDHQVELLLGTPAIELDLGRHELVAASGQRLAFNKMLLATGSTPRRLTIPGADLDGIRYLRRAEDADQLRVDISGGDRHVVIVGGGWIGLEVAAAARGYGNDVTVIEPQTTVLNAALGQQMGEVFADLHRAHGVRLLTDHGVQGFEGAAGRVTSVQLTSGEPLAADVVLVGVGAQPEVALAQEAGLSVDNGVLVDASLQTSHPDVYAAGDIANTYNPLLGRHLRVEHWANALHSGPAAARAMLGHPVSYDRLPYFYTDQYDLGLEYTGAIGPDGYDQLVVRGDQDHRTFVAFWLKDGRVLAGMNVNTWDVADSIQALIRSQAVVDPQRLADIDVPLDELADTASA